MNFREAFCFSENIAHKNISAITRFNAAVLLTKLCYDNIVDTLFPKLLVALFQGTIAVFVRFSSYIEATYLIDMKFHIVSYHAVWFAKTCLSTIKVLQN